MKNTRNIYISAGEASGDLLGADLARALLAKDPTLTLTGMGGNQMKQAGVSIQFQSEALSVVGFSEVFKQLPRIIFTWHRIKQYFKKNKPDLVILIDFPDTHFRFFKTLKKLGIPVLYYVSPQIWAWRYHRINAIKKYVDHIAVLFSFEEKIYRDAHIPVTFVGHPLGQLVKPTLSTEAAYDYFHLNPAQPIVTLLPGSRQSELDNHLPILMSAVEKIKEKIPNAQFALMLANHFHAEKIGVLLPSHIKIVQHHLYDLLSITNAAVAASGTVTLEIALMKTPFCIMYRLKPLSFWLAKKLIRVKYIGLCNIVAEKMIAKEFIQENANADRIADHVITLLSDQKVAASFKEACDQLRKNVIDANDNPSEKVARIALSLL